MRSQYEKGCQEERRVMTGHSGGIKRRSYVRQRFQTAKLDLLLNFGCTHELKLYFDLWAKSEKSDHLDEFDLNRKKPL